MTEGQPLVALRMAGYPPTVGQRRILRRYVGRPEEAANHLAVAYRFPMQLDPGRAKEAFAQTFSRHSIFGTTFEHSQGTWHASLRSFDPLLTVQKLAGGVGEIDAAIKEACAEFAAPPFDLAAAPLSRAAIFTTAQSSTICFVVHHAIFDAWSQHLAVADMNRALANALPLPAPGSTYADFARRQAMLLADGAFDQQLAGFADARNHLRVDWERGDCTAGNDNRPAYLEVFINQRTSDLLRRQCRALDATVYSCILAAVGHGLAQITGSSDPAIVCARHGRNDPDYSGTVGYFVTLAPIRVGDSSANATVGDVIRSATTRLRAVIVTGDVPADLSMLDVDRSGTSPAGSVLLNYRNVPELVPMVDGVAATPLPVKDSQAEYDLSLLIDDQPDGGIRLAAKYNTSVAGAGQIRRILSHVKIWLELAATDTQLRMSSLDL